MIRPDPRGVGETDSGQFDIHEKMHMVGKSRVLATHG
jgi:hypothetical protein